MFYTEKQTKNNMRARRACESASILSYQWWKRAQIQKYQFIIFTKKRLLVCAPHQWRNVAPVAPASPGGAMRRGRQNFELKLFGCKNVPYVGQINVQWWGKNIWGYKKLQGAPKSFRGRQKAPGGARSL